MNKIINVNFKATPEESRAMKDDAFEHHMTLSAYIRWLAEQERERFKKGKG